MLRTLVALGSVALAIAVGPPARARPCDPARYQIMGQILDPASRPLADARVRLLLDEVSAQRYEEVGPRARATRTNPSGIYVVLIDCDEARGVTDAPSPCAGKPRHLTVLVEATGYRAKLIAFKLKDLTVTRDAGGCLVQVPNIKLSG